MTRGEFLDILISIAIGFVIADIFCGLMSFDWKTMFHAGFWQLSTLAIVYAFVGRKI